MEIKILGTVSPYCKDEKNCPGYLVTSGNKKVLLDCGNGISRNLNLPQDFEDLTIIISHLHKDHYGELLSLGYATYVFKKLGLIHKRVKVYLPKLDCEEDIIKPPYIDFLLLKNFGDEHYFEFLRYDEKTKLTIGNMQIDFVKNIHPINTYATRIKEEGKIVVYSSDTGYQNNNLLAFTRDSDILICESTYLRGQIRTEDNHLYANEAAQIAKNANVKELILTHFFPEVDKAEYVNEAKEYFENTTAAEEGKILKIGGGK